MTGYIRCWHVNTSYSDFVAHVKSTLGELYLHLYIQPYLHLYRGIYFYRCAHAIYSCWQLSRHRWALQMEMDKWVPRTGSEYKYTYRYVITDRVTQLMGLILLQSHILSMEYIYRFSIFSSICRTMERALKGIIERFVRVRIAPCFRQTGCRGSLEAVLSIAPMILVKSSLPAQNGTDFAEDIFRCIFMNDKFWILIRSSLNFDSKGPIDNNLELVQIMALCRTGDKPLSQPMLKKFIDTHMRGD